MITKKTALANALLVAYQTKSSPDDLVKALTTAVDVLIEKKQQLNFAQKMLEIVGDRPIDSSLSRDVDRYKRVAHALDQLAILKVAAEKAQTAHVTVEAEGGQA